MTETKFCSACKVCHPVEDFNFTNTFIGRRESACRVSRNAAKRQRHVPKVKESGRQYVARYADPEIPAAPAERTELDITHPHICIKCGERFRSWADYYRHRDEHERIRYYIQATA